MIERQKQHMHQLPLHYSENAQKKVKEKTCLKKYISFLFWILNVYSFYVFFLIFFLHFLKLFCKGLHVTDTDKQKKNYWIYKHWLDQLWTMQHKTKWIFVNHLKNVNQQGTNMSECGPKYNS